MAFYNQRPDLKAYLELFLSIVTIAFLTIFAIKPTVVTIIDLLNKINAEQQTSDQLDTKIRNLTTAQNLYNNNQDKISLLSLAVPQVPDVSSYIRQNEGVMKKDNTSPVNVSVDEVSLSNATASGSFNVTSIVSGDYSGLLGYLRDIEALRRPSFVSKLDILSQTQQGIAILNLSATLKVPYN